MTKNAKSTVGLYFVLGTISRGRPNERQPGDLFVPAEEDIDFLLENEVIRPAEEAEIALWEKTHQGDDAAEAAAAEAAAAEAAAAEAAAAEAKAKVDKKPGTTKTPAEEQLA